MPTHPAIAEGRSAVITGAASGLGLAAAKRLAAMGMRVVLADLPGEALDRAVEAVKAMGATVVAIPTDVSDYAAVQRLKGEAYAAFGEVAVLMNNAGVGRGGGAFSNMDGWRKVLATNLWGPIHGVHAFTEAMIAQGTDAAIINTGSKQGITTPPGDAAYNVSKAGVKVLTEQLAHELRNTAGCKVTAHLFVPGFVFTGLTGGGGLTEKPKGAWTAEQTIDHLLERIGGGEFYVLCPDETVDRAIDEKRIAWAAGDLIESRPALSRWHPDYKDAFETFMKR